MEGEKGDIVTHHVEVGDAVQGVGDVHAVLFDCITLPNPLHDDLHIKSHATRPDLPNNFKEGFERVDATSTKGILAFEPRFKANEKTGHFASLFA